MKADALTRAALVAMLAVAAALGAHADDPVYITGAEYAIDGNTLTVSSGNGLLVQQTPSNLTHIWIMEGASLKLTTDGDAFGSPTVMHVFGTLDVNGKSFSALRLDNRTDATSPDRTTCGRIINTSETGSTIKLTSNASQGSPYFGTFEELPGKISVESSTLFFAMRSPTVASPASEFTFSERTVLSVVDRPTKIKFVFRPPADATKPIRLAEISLTDHGLPVSSRSVTVSSEATGHAGTYLVDIASSTYWSAAETGEQTVEIETFGVNSIDGYKITPYDGAPASGIAAASTDTSYRPSGWDVYVWRDTYFRYVLVDSRSDFSDWYPYNGTTSTTNLTFASIGLFGNPFGENVSVTLNNTASNYAAKVSGNETVKVGKFTSKGEVLIADGSTFAPGDISESTGAFTANGSTAQRLARLELSSRGGAEQLLSITNAQNLAIVNGGSEPVSVLLDDSRTGEHLFGSLKDGENGQLGLVKRGSGERVIETEDSSYTGPTVVHGGTLTVARKRSPITARYLRFSPLTTYSASGTGYRWSANELQLFDANGNLIDLSGATVSKPAGTNIEHGTAKLARLVDGDTATRILMPDYSTGSDLPPVIIDTVTGVTFSSYSWWTATDTNEQKSRVVTSWLLEVSNDGENWTVCDRNAKSADDFDKAVSKQRGPFALNELNGAARSTGAGLRTLSETGLFAAGTPRDTHRKLKAQYFRFRVFETVAPFATSDSWGWQLTEIGLMKDGARVDWPAATTGTMIGSSTHASEMHLKLFDNVIWQDDNGNVSTANRCFVRTLPSAVVINAHEPLEFDAYSLTTTSPSSSQGTRLPKTWFMEVSLDGSNYYRIDAVSGYTRVGNVLTKAYQEMGPFPVAEKWPLLDMGAGDSLGDKSPVAIDAGATLKLATDYEKFGPLSGAGALELKWDAVGEINACAPATFSGSVTGKGTLAVCGDDVQTFDGATLSGAETLELNGGAIAGTASFGGNDVTVAFNGGATGAALSGIGTLAVTGGVKYALPDVSNIATYTNTLFTATNISAESRALLSAGEFVGSSRKWAWKVAVTDTAVVLIGNKRGTTMVIR